MSRGRYVSAAEAAEASGRCARTIRRMCERGEIDGAECVGGTWIVPRSWIEGGSVEPVTDADLVVAAMEQVRREIADLRALILSAPGHDMSDCGQDGDPR